MKDDTHMFISTMKKSKNVMHYGGKLTHCLGIISSVLKGGSKANIKSTVSSENKNMRIMLPYGIASAPYKGLQAQVLFNDDTNVIVGFYDSNRPDTSPGDVILYNKSQSTIKISADGKITVSTGSATVDLDGPSVAISGSIAVSGSFTINGSTVQEIVSSMI